MDDPKHQPPENAPHDRVPYEPPRAEEVDTGLGPAETAPGGPPAGTTPPLRGVEESARWH